MIIASTIPRYVLLDGQPPRPAGTLTVVGDVQWTSNARLAQVELLGATLDGVPVKMTAMEQAWASARLATSFFEQYVEMLVDHG